MATLRFTSLTFDKHLRDKGWLKDPAVDRDDAFLKAAYTLEGNRIELQVSRKLEDKGWCSLSFKPGGT